MKYFGGVKDRPNSMSEIDSSKPRWDASILYVVKSIENLSNVLLVWIFPYLLRKQPFKNVISVSTRTFKLWWVILFVSYLISWCLL